MSQTDQNKIKNKENNLVGKCLQILVVPGSKPRGFFEVIEQNPDGTYNVRAPNGKIDKNVPQEDLEGDISIIDEEFASQYIH